MSHLDHPILVTGSAGFIGFSLCRQLLEEGYQIVGLDHFNHYYPVQIKEQRSAILKQYPNFCERRIDLSDRVAIEKLFGEFKFSRVCNLAAQAGVRYSLTNPYAYEKSNLEGFLNLIEQVRHYQVPRLVYASSSSVYGGNTKIPFSESDPVDSPISFYAVTKRANELTAHCYAHLYGVHSVGLRFFTVYGPWGRPDMAMWIFAEKILKGEPIPVFNQGQMKRDFTYIDDIVAGIKSSLFTENLDKYEIFNLGNHRTENLSDMIELIEKNLGKKGKWNLLPMQPGDVPETYADIQRAQNKLGFSPKTSLVEGITQFVNWFNEHPDIVADVAQWRKLKN